MLRGFLPAFALLCAPAGAQVAYPPSLLSIADIPQYVMPASGGTVVVQPGYSALVINNSSLLATLTVQLPPAPIDGQRIILTCGAAITVLVIDGNGITVKGLMTGMTANGYGRYIYSSSANAWFRTG